MRRCKLPAYNWRRHRHNTVPLSLIRSTVTASARRPREEVGGAGSAPPLNLPLTCNRYILKPVHIGDYSRRFRRQFVAENGDCRRKVRLSQKTATENCDSCRFLRQSHFSATVAVFGDSVDRALRHLAHSLDGLQQQTIRRYLTGQETGIYRE